MRILVVGDLHARAVALGEFQELAEAVLGVVRERRPDRVVLAGDLLHEHAHVHTGPLNAVLDFLRPLREVAPVHALMGNHDLASNQCFLEPRHAFNAVKAWEGVTIVDEVRASDDGRFLYVPFVPPGRFVEALDGAVALGRLARPWQEAEAIFAHQDFVGARQGEIVLRLGEKWRPSWPLVVSGHVHEHQWLQKNLCYVGAPRAHTFGLRADHTVSLFTFGPEGRREDRIALGLPRKITLEISVAEAETFEPPARDLVRLVVKGPAASLLAFKGTPRYKALAASVAKLILQAVESREPGRRREAKSFMALLQEAVVQEPAAVRELFAELVPSRPGQPPSWRPERETGLA
jgi:hypothetical protein